MMRARERVSIRDHFVNAPSQWETTLQCNVASHWLGTYSKWSLQYALKTESRHDVNCVVTGGNNSLFVQQLAQANNKGNIKTPHYGPFVNKIYWWPMDSPRKGPVMRTMFPCHDMINSPMIIREDAWYKRVSYFTMMTSSNGNILRVTGLFVGNSPVTGEFLAQRPVTRSFYVLFDLRLNKQLSKHSWGRWFETSSGSLWRYCYGMSVFVKVFEKLFLINPLRNYFALMNIKNAKKLSKIRL